MMIPIEELKIEYRRLRRHVNYLENRFSPAVARDLSASLRNWVQLADIVDEVAGSEGWVMKFTKEVLPKASKRIRSQGPSEAFSLPAGVKSKNMQISGVVIYNHKVSQEDFKTVYEAERCSAPTTQLMSFNDWLNNSAYQLRIKGSNKDIPRRVFIDRSANLLGGTHPMSNFNESEHLTWADPYIIGLLNTQVGLLPAPYAILMESAQEIVKVFKSLQ